MFLTRSELFSAKLKIFWSVPFLQTDVIIIDWNKLCDNKNFNLLPPILIYRHVFFWSMDRKWRLILTCAGVIVHPSLKDINKLHASIKKSARYDDIKGTWVMVVKKAFPKLTSIDDDDTPTGLLHFIKCCYDKHFDIDLNDNELCEYIMGAFPALTLSLYRMLESGCWLEHPTFSPFTVIGWQCLHL